MVLTADERFWPDTGAVLFLGEWCKLYSRRAVWQAMDAATVPHPWHDFSRFSQDYAYLRGLYDRLLPALAECLNRLHACQHDVRYWQILVGPWLATFLHVAFERWTVLSTALTKWNVSDVAAGSFESLDHVPRHMNDFHDRVAGDAWNGFLFSSMLRYLSGAQKRMQQNLAPDTVCAQSMPPSRRGAFALNLVKFVGRMLGRRQDHFMISTYVPLERLVGIQLCLGQFPTRWQSPTSPVVAPEEGWRGWQVSFAAENQFEGFLVSMFHQQLPTVFCEGYAALQSVVQQMPWPVAPSSIFTSNALWGDEVVMEYTASQVEKGARLLYGQHGGLYGVGAFSWAEEHERSIADRYLTWGWSESPKQKFAPVGYFKRQLVRAGRKGKQTDLVLVCYDYPRYTHRLDSEAMVMLSGYLDNCLSFAEALEGGARDELLVRLTPREHGWFQESRWRDRFAMVRIDRGSRSMGQLMLDARLLIYTYNSTGLIEALVSNKPCVMFWDHSVSRLRGCAEPEFTALRSVGILHESPESAARHVSRVWYDVAGWWDSVEVQSAVQMFSNRFCSEPSQASSNIIKVFGAEQ
uniref:Transferase n=1 Tax=Curvibacter symbiont subsp. Hydra magnipapillata TaxID=667019 RepID=C9YDK7_CURXX|nr:hypothetical protein Csp_F37040 [Curvibacter putative symbiont of Hydra magnipapillata]